MTAQTAMTNLLDLAAERMGVSFALLAAIQRSWGAEIDGDMDARKTQLLAAADFADRLTDSVAQQAAADVAFDQPAQDRTSLPSTICRRHRSNARRGAVCNSAPLRLRR